MRLRNRVLALALVATSVGVGGAVGQPTGCPVPDAAGQKDGSLGSPETVTIEIEPLRDLLFLVTWQESDKTTVVHLEDYRDWKITTHITGADGSFQIFRGTMQELGADK